MTDAMTEGAAAMSAAPDPRAVAAALKSAADAAVALLYGQPFVQAFDQLAAYAQASGDPAARAMVASLTAHRGLCATYFAGLQAQATRALAAAVASHPEPAQ